MQLYINYIYLLPHRSFTLRGEVDINEMESPLVMNNGVNNRVN